MSRLDLIVPGLLGPFSSDVSENMPFHIHDYLQKPVFKELGKWLSRASVNVDQADTFYSTLVSLIDPQCEMSISQLTSAFDGLDTSQGNFYRADPVHFKAESDHAILLGTDLILPDESETEQLIQAFNQHFKDDKVSLHDGGAGRWYLQTEKALDLQFHAIDYALGRDIKHFMPTGKDELWWRKIVNEAQMLFFQHTVNQKREDNRQLAINGLWLWDLNVDFKQNEPLSISTIYTDDIVAKSLASQSGTAASSLSFINRDNESLSDCLVINDQLYASVCYGDIDAWLEELEGFCGNFISRISNLINSAKVDTVYIYPCDGRVFIINRWKLLQFWKMQKPLDEFIVSS